MVWGRQPQLLLHSQRPELQLQPSTGEAQQLLLLSPACVLLQWGANTLQAVEVLLASLIRLSAPLQMGCLVGVLAVEGLTSVLAAEGQMTVPVAVELSSGLLLETEIE